MVQAGAISSIANLVACTLLLLSWRKVPLRGAQFCVFFAFCLALGYLGISPGRFFPTETMKWTIFGILVLVLVLVHVKYIVALRWRFTAEWRAEELAGSGRYDEAIQLLQTKRVSEGATLLLLNDLAHCLDAVGEQEEALRILDEAEVRFGKQRELTVKRAVCLTRLGQTDEALAVMRAAVEASPHDFELAYQFTVMYLKLDRRDDAEAQFDRTEILYLREKSDEVRQQWRPKLERLRRRLYNSPMD